MGSRWRSSGRLRELRSRSWIRRSGIREWLREVRRYASDRRVAGARAELTDLCPPSPVYVGQIKGQKKSGPYRIRRRARQDHRERGFSVARSFSGSRWSRVARRSRARLHRCSGNRRRTARGGGERWNHRLQHTLGGWSVFFTSALLPAAYVFAPQDSRVLQSIRTTRSPILSMEPRLRASPERKLAQRV